MKRKVLFIVITIFSITLGLSAADTAQIRNWLVDTQPGLYYVESVADGDTIIVNMNGELETIRFIGVDTPETHHPSKPVQCFGEAASRFTTNLLDGQEVRLESDPSSDNRDRYNRLLRYVYQSDELINEKLISEGYGFAYTAFPHSKLESFVEAESEARELKIGLWSGCDLEINKYGSQETSPA